MKTAMLAIMITVTSTLVGAPARTEIVGAFRGAGPSIDWYSIDGGGEIALGVGTIELSSTLGQPDAGAVMTSGTIELTGGFWAVTVAGPCPAQPADLNGDCQIDLNDFATLAVCFNGPDVTSPPPGCSPDDFAASDIDGDGDVDLVDFATFASNFGG